MIKLFTWRSTLRRMLYEKYPNYAEVQASGGWAAGVIFNPHAMWLGLHYSQSTHRYCLNLVPCVTLWFAPTGGIEP